MGEKLSKDREKYYREMVATFPCAAFVSWDDRTAGTVEVLCANNEYYQLTGIAENAIEFGDHDVNNLSDVATEDRIRINKLFGEAVANKNTIATDASIRRVDGTYMRCRIHARPLETHGNACLFVVTFHRYDDKDPEKIIKRHYVEHDALTNIFNLKGFCQQTAEVLATFPEREFMIVVSDIDSFKTINNMFGDEVGDMILKRMGTALKDHFATLFMNNVPGSYGRIGSDRFAVCIPVEMADPKRIVDRANEMLLTLDLNYHVQMHFGLCEVPRDRSYEVSDIIEQAYLACSTVKHNMQIRYAYYDNDLRKGLLEEQELITQAEAALKNGEFIPYYQPVYLSGTGRLISAEALIRWDHPEKGLLPPQSFVPVMERNGFIATMDSFMWKHVLMFLRDRIRAGKKIIPISVNMSRQDIFNPHLAEELEALVREYGIHPSYLHIEVTESAYIDEEMQLADTIGKLRKSGFIVLMDDFGSGYSSLNVLKDMPVDIMKIDRGLTVDIETSERGKAMLGAIIRLANKLYIPTIAEGVETETQYTYLKEIGCDSIQGYYFSKPVPEAEFARLLDEADIPEYETGESMPGHFVQRDKDYSPRQDGILFLGSEEEERSIPAKLLMSDYRISAARDLREAETVLARDNTIDYVIISRELYDSMIQKKPGDDGNAQM